MTLNGIIRGNVIELERPTGLEDGQAVRLEVTPASQTAASLASIEPDRRDAGGGNFGADDPNASRISLEEFRRLTAGSKYDIDNPSEPMIPIEDWEMLK